MVKCILKFYSDKVKVQLFLGLIIYAPCHEDEWGNEGTAPSFSSLALDGSEWSVSYP
jgi:hypothetical protein